MEKWKLILRHQDQHTSEVHGRWRYELMNQHLQNTQLN